MQMEIDYYKPLQLLKYPDPILSMKCLEVPAFDEHLSHFCTQMFLFMKNNLKWGRPVGLAAPQVGQPIRVFIAENVLYINPEITWITKAPPTICKEGCYSLEDSRYDYEAKRFASIRMKWQDEKGEWHDGRFNGYHAQVIQHEMDHLG